MKSGDIFEFSYLWARQADAGEESGRKIRPICLFLNDPQNPTVLLLFPFTTKQPDAHEAIALSELDCKRSGLKYPCWLILDEFNHTKTSDIYDFASLNAIGALSPALLKKAAIAINRIRQALRVRGIKRL